MDNEKILKCFRLMAPEFSDVKDDELILWIEQTVPLVGKKRFDQLYHQAVALMVAHRLKMQGHGDNSMGSIGQSMRISSFTEGGRSISFNSVQPASGDSNAALAMTQYGLDFLNLRSYRIIPIISAGEA